MQSYFFLFAQQLLFYLLNSIKLYFDVIRQQKYRFSIAEEWKVHRRFVSPTINQAGVSLHLPVFNENIRKTVGSLAANEYFDILSSISKCKISMFVEAALGTDWEPDVKQSYLRNIFAYVSKLWPIKTHFTFSHIVRAKKI